MKVGKRPTIISNEIKLATTLRFLAQGSYQVGVGNDFKLALSQPTVSAILAERLEALEQVICPLLIRFEMSEEEQTEVIMHFFQKAGFPGVIGCVDGTHIKISAPTKLDQNLYFNRKGFFSLNAIIICDHKMKIRYFDARYAGSSHDSLIWNISSAKQVLRERYDSGVRNAWLLGDAGYPLEPYLMTPYRSTSEGSAESIFNTKHAKTRNIIERTIGVFKNRFRCLLGARQLHYKSEKAMQIANVCAALHNLCIDFNVESSSYDSSSEAENVQDGFEIDVSDDLQNMEAT
ncbi:PREDICTED: putative nuclease HARBI1 [Rhagoletis zephyria]|uniref:putative nuclease HARBI1 n=1 Tax=Rhagoletis zephyria TaxID=28612 RepID=UPI00081168D4|nr:PREDICTED: putative nuclease HARBI1 [Rhagoletis zephyria]